MNLTCEKHSVTKVFIRICTVKQINNWEKVAYDLSNESGLSLKNKLDIQLSITGLRRYEPQEPPSITSNENLSELHQQI